MYQLLLPLEQSPEYSFNCIPSIPALSDPRNVYWAATYLTVVVLGLSGIYHVCSSSAASNNRSNACSAPVDSNVKSSASSGVHVSAEGTGHNNNIISDEVNSPLDDSSGTIPPAGASSLPPISVCTAPTHYDYAPTALLDGLIWLVVPFVPASGLVFKLGTLLAERLLYMCSIGFCLLLATVLYSAVTALVSAASGAVRVKDKGVLFQRTSLVTKVVYWVVIACIAAGYTMRTLEYNTVWINNETLFIRSLAVCPNSAKMHMQVSKVFYA